MVRSAADPGSAFPRQALAWVVIALIFLVILFPANSALADISPPAQPPGANPHPGGESTRVRMLAETVLIDVRGDAPGGSLGQARVTAGFHMRNLGASAESLDVRFPISVNDGFFNYPEIRDLRVSVDGRATPTRRVTIPDPASNDPIQWATFPVTFPPEQEVDITVTYTLEGTGEYPYIAFSYLLETGAGWQGTIGSVDLTMRLPYEANAYNVFIDSSPGWGMTSPGANLVGREVRWHYDDLEPTFLDNLSIALVMPSAWKVVLAEQAKVAADPQDGEAWGRLGKIYKEVSLQRRDVRRDEGGLALYELSVEAYEKAVTLLPEDALWHAGYGDLLFARYYYEEYIAGGRELTHVFRAIQEYHRAYSLAPDNARVRDMLDEVRFAMPEAVRLEGDQYIFLWMTATPTLQVPTSTPTVTPPAPTRTATQPPATDTAGTPSATPTPTREAQATPAPTVTTAETPGEEVSRPGLCGGSLATPVALSFLYLAYRLHKPRQPALYA